MSNTDDRAVCPAYDMALEQEAIREWTAERLELGMSQLTEAEISALFVDHFDDEI